MLNAISLLKLLTKVSDETSDKSYVSKETTKKGNQMNTVLRFHWYDGLSKEGVFKDAKTGAQVYVNFELCERSHKAALKGMKGQYYKGNLISGIVNEIWQLTNNEGVN